MSNLTVIEHHFLDPVVAMLIHRRLVKYLITMTVTIVTWLTMHAKPSHPAHHQGNLEHHSQLVIGKVAHLMLRLDLNMHRRRSQITRIFLEENLRMELRKCLYMSTMSSKDIFFSLSYHFMNTSDRRKFWCQKCLINDKIIFVILF